MGPNHGATMQQREPNPPVDLSSPPAVNWLALASTLFGAALLALGLGCQSSAHTDQASAPQQLAPATETTGAQDLATAENSKPNDGMAQAGGGAGGLEFASGAGGSAEAEVAAAPVAQDADDEGDEESKDYWKGVEFGPTQFEEMLEFVTEHYIDAKVDEARAYAEACHRAFWSLETQYYALPKSFYEARKGHADEEGELDGTASPLPGKSGVVLVKAPTKEEREKRKEEKPKKRKSDDEIRELRDRFKERRRQLDQAWRTQKFDRKALDGCIAHARKLGQADSKQKQEELARDIWLGAGLGYLSALDPHSALVSAKAWEESTKRTTDSSFDGIGAILTKRIDDGSIIVENPIEGQPAVGAGVRAGDRIIKVDEKDVSGMELQPVVQRIRGPRGTYVKLTVRRDGEPDDIEISIQRAYIKIENVTSKFVSDHKDIGYVKLSGFVPTSATKLREAIGDLQKQSKTGRLRGLVLDLRNNSGGLLQQAVEIADIFLREGVIVTVKDRANTQKGEKIYRASSKEFVDLPLVVLVNDSSASASEIVAGAVQDNKRGLVVGDRTFGKASVQTLYNPRRGRDYYIKLTVARYYAPSGRTIQVLGIRPDFEVPPEVGKPLPLGYREENLSNHLGAIETGANIANAELRDAVQACAEKRGTAEKIHQANPNPQIKFDYPLMKAADYLECMADLRAQAKAGGDTPQSP